MAFDFPASPTSGQTYTDAATGMVYTFDGVVWAPGGGGIQATSPYVLKTGDAMLGFLSLVGPPTAALHATTKQYTDELIAAESLFQGVWNVASNDPDLTPASMNPLHSYSWIAQTVDPAVPETALAALPGIGGKSIAATDTIVWNNVLQLYEHIRGAVSVSQMLINDAPPATAFHGQQWWDSDNGKHYVFYDDGTSQYWIQTSGGGGATKAEVYFGDVAPDPTFSGELWWDTSTGNMMINQNGVWVQTNLEEAPVDGQEYVRANAGWVAATTAANLSNYLPLAGGTLTGDLRTAPAAIFRPEILSGAVSTVVFEPTVQGASGQCSIRITQNTTAKPSGIMEFWTENGNYGVNWAFKIALGGPPGIDVNGTVTAASLADRSLLADPALAAFARGEGEERGIDVGQLLRWAVLELIELKAEMAQLKGRQ